MPTISAIGGGSAKGYGFTSGSKFTVSGGTRSEAIISGTPYTFFTFNSPGTMTVIGGGSLEGVVLVVGGGENGVSTGPGSGGNGGAGGGVLQVPQLFRAGTHSIVRGAAPGGASSVAIPYGTPIASPGTAGAGGSPLGAPGGAGVNTTIFGTTVAYGGGGGAGGTPSSNGGVGGAGGAGGGGAGGLSFAVQNPPNPAWPLAFQPVTGPPVPVPPEPITFSTYGNPGSPGTMSTGGGGGGGAYYDYANPTYPAPIAGSGAPGTVVVRFRTYDLRPS